MNIGTEYTKSLGYDTYGRLSTVTAGNDVFTYGYLTNSNLVQSVSVSASSVPVCVTTNTYEANRNLITQVKNEELVGTSSIVLQRKVQKKTEQEKEEMNGRLIQTKKMMPLSLATKLLHQCVVASVRKRNKAERIMYVYP